MKLLRLVHPVRQITVTAADQEKPPAWNYVFCMLCSVIFWENVRTDDGVKKLMPVALRPQFSKSAREAEAFLKKYRIPVRDWRAYTEWIVDGEPEEDGYTEELLADHLKSLREAQPALKRDQTVTDLWLDVIDQLRKWHKTENASTLEKIKQTISKLDMPSELAFHFQTEVESQEPYIAELKRLVKRLTGEATTVIPMDLKPEIREKRPDDWKKYLALQNKLNTIYKQTLREHVRSKGGRVESEQLRKYFDAKKMAHRVPKGFNGLMDEDGQLYTRDGDLIDSGNIDSGAQIVMNPDYSKSKDAENGRNKNYVFKVILPTKDAHGNPNVQHKYTVNKLKLNKEKKFGVVQELLDNEKSLVSKWRRDLKSPDMTKKILAAQCELSYTTCIRIGGKGNKNTKTGETYGLTTLTVANVKKRGQDRILDYIGKDSVHQRHVIKPVTPEMKIVIKLLDQLCEDKNRKDLLFQWNGVTYDAPKLRKYFVSISGVADATPHKLRHLRGTRLAMGTLQAQLDKLVGRSTVTQKQADDAFKEALTEVGELLGHVRGVGAEQKITWSTAANAYIDPSAMGDYYAQLESFGVRIPKSLKKALGKS